MQEIRCENCGKFLMEAEGQANIRKICPKCKTVNNISIGAKSMNVIKK